jgi:hypothetical protein
VPALLKKLKPWEDYTGAAASLRTAIERFTKTRQPTRNASPRKSPARKTARRN